MIPPFALLAACGPPTPSVATMTRPPVADPAPWTYPGADEDPGPMDPAALGRALDAAVLGALAYPASPMIDAYVARYDRSAAPQCPAAIDDGAGSVYWANGCSAPDGTYFGGYVTWSHFEGLESDGILLDGDTVTGNVTLIDPDGGTLDLEGAAVRIWGQSTDGTTDYVQSSLVGGFALDAADASGWLLDGMQSVELTVTAVTVPSVDGLVTVVDGAVVAPLDDGVYSLRFTGVTMANAAVGSACEQEPGGAIVVRDAAGRWAEIAFQGPVFGVDSGDAAQCDGCGDAVQLSDGAPLGPVCADFTPWLEASR